MKLSNTADPEYITLNKQTGVTERINYNEKFEWMVRDGVGAMKGLLKTVVAHKITLHN